MPDPQSASLASLVAGGDQRARDTYRRFREPAVQAYTSRACSLDAISTQTVGAAFDAVADSPDLPNVSSDAELDALLLNMTRREAAARTSSPRADSQVGGFASISRKVSGRLKRNGACQAMPKLLTARAAGLLEESELVRLDRHLAHCYGCRMLAARFDRAEEAFAARVAANPLPSPDNLDAKPSAEPEPGASSATVPAPVPIPPAQATQPAPSATGKEGTAGEPVTAAKPGAPDKPKDAPADPATRPAPRPPAGGPPRAPYIDPAGRSRRPSGPLIAALVIGLLLVAGGVYWFGIRDQAPPVEEFPPVETIGSATTPVAPTETPVYDVTGITASVLNAAGDNKAVSEAESRLSAAGFQIGDTSESTEDPVDCTTVVFVEGDPVSRRQGLAAKRKLLPLRSVLLQPLPPDEVKQLTQGADVAVLAGPDLVENLPDDHCGG